MTSKSEPTEQVRFLVACIRNGNAGRVSFNPPCEPKKRIGKEKATYTDHPSKPDFQAVADELNIVSKAAA